MSNRDRRRLKKKDATVARGERKDPYVPNVRGITRYSKEWIQACRGQHVEVYWPLDRAYYTGHVAKVQTSKAKSVLVHYEDGDKEWLDLSKERYRFVRGKDFNNQDDDGDDDDDEEVDNTPPHDSDADSDSKVTTQTHRGSKRKRSEDSHDESEAPPKKRTRPRGRPKSSRKQQARQAAEESASDSEMNDVHSNKAKNNSRGRNTTNGNINKKNTKSVADGRRDVSSTTATPYGGMESNGNLNYGSHVHGMNNSATISHDHPNVASNSTSSPHHHAPSSLTFDPNISKQVSSIFPSNSITSHVATVGTPTNTGLSHAGAQLQAVVGSAVNVVHNMSHNGGGVHGGLMSQQAQMGVLSQHTGPDGMIDQHVSVIDRTGPHDAVVIDYRNNGSRYEYQVQYDGQEDSLWVDIQQIREQQPCLSEKGEKGGYVLALDNNQWFKGVVEEILGGVSGVIFRIAFPQFDSSPFMYFPDKRVQKYRQDAEDERVMAT